MITPRSYAEKLSKSERLVAEKVKDYLKEPSEDNVHDLRTSIRRMLATAAILPKKMRGKNKAKKYLSDYEKLLRLNAEVRDLDIVLSKMVAHDEEPSHRDLMKKLREGRESGLKKAQRFASSVRDEAGLSVQANDFSSSSLRKRFKKTVAQLSEKMAKRIRVVVREPANKMELHKLREDSRRLRYVLELDNSPDTSKLLTVLASWQEMLGVIHDADIFIERFKDGKGSSLVKPLLESETSSRNENYEKFRAIAKESPKFRLDN